MGFGQKISRAFRLSRQSLQLLAGSPGLLVLPFASGVVLIVIMATFLAPILASEELRTLLDGDGADTEIADYVYAFAFYLVAFTAANIFNVALVHAILTRLHGGTSSAGAGLRFAMTRLPQILMWSLVSATVGVILKVIQDKAGIAGQIVGGLAGLAWSVATYFAVPVLAAEGTGPVATVQRSAAVLRKTWGESLATNIGVGLVMLLPTLVLVGAFALAAATLPAELLIVAGVVIGVLFALLLLVSATLSVTLRAALYHYAVDGNAPPPFDRADFDAAFVKKAAKTA